LRHCSTLYQLLGKPETKLFAHLSPEDYREAQQSQWYSNQCTEREREREGGRERERERESLKDIFTYFHSNYK